MYVYISKKHKYLSKYVKLYKSLAAAVHNMKIPLGNVHIMLTNRFFVIVIYLCMFIHIINI